MMAKHEQRWRGRPVASACLRFFVFAAPIGASVATASVIAPRLHATRWYHLVGNVLLVFAVSTAALALTDRLARRLLPLAVLLRLSLAFPNEAPSRIALARRAVSTRDLEARVEEARREGVTDEPARTAEQILSLIAAVEAHDRATRGHSERVRIYTDLLAEQLRLADHDRDRLRWSALLHDVGKLRVPAKVLNKPSKLNKREWALVQRHPDEGARLAQPLRPWLASWAPAIEEHHERFDGQGYPRGLAGTGISYGGRIVAVADSYETMTASRPYMRARTAAKARAELVACSGTHFDPQIVRAFLEISVRRLALASGPLSWLAQMPFFRGLESAASVAGQVAGRAVAGGVVAIAVSPVTAAAPHVATAADTVRATTVSTPSPAASSVDKDDQKAVDSPTPSPSPRPTTVIDPKPSPRPTPSPSESPGKLNQWWLDQQKSQ